MVGFGLIFSLF
jgi:hypothetical protein